LTFDDIGPCYVTGSRFSSDWPFALIPTDSGAFAYQLSDVKFADRFAVLRFPALAFFDLELRALFFSTFDAT
jgi:hypothetical protein